MSTISLSPLVSFASIRRSSSSIWIAMMPPFRMLLKSVRFDFLTMPRARREDDVQVLVPGFVDDVRLGAGLLRLDADRRGDLLVAAELEQVRDGAAFRGAAHLGDFVDPLDVAAADVGEEHQVIVRRRGEEMLDEIAFVLFASRLRASSCR